MSVGQYERKEISERECERECVRKGKRGKGEKGKKKDMGRS
jgi:hypothetical protein